MDDSGKRQISAVIVLATPWLFLIPILLFYSPPGVIHWVFFGWGCLGWWLALMLRMPFIGLFKFLQVKKFISEKTSGFCVVLLSGPCEEGIRVMGMLLLGISDFSTAYSVGFGWCTIEAVFTAVQAFAMIQLLKKDDEKSREAREKMKEMTGVDFSSISPFMAIPERIAANMVHISFTLFLLHSPYIVFATVVIHSSINILIVPRKGGLSLEVGESLFFAFAVVCFALGLVFLKP